MVFALIKMNLNQYIVLKLKIVIIAPLKVIAFTLIIHVNNFLFSARIREINNSAIIAKSIRITY